MIYKCENCGKEYKSERYYLLHTEKCEIVEVKEEIVEVKEEIVEVKEEIVEVEEEIVEFDLANLEKVSKRFKMTGGFSATDVDFINEMFTYFTGKCADPTSCSMKMVYRTQTVAQNYYNKYAN